MLIHHLLTMSSKQKLTTSTSKTDKKLVIEYLRSFSSDSSSKKLTWMRVDLDGDLECDTEYHGSTPEDALIDYVSKLSSKEVSEKVLLTWQKEGSESNEDLMREYGILRETMIRTWCSSELENLVEVDENDESDEDDEIERKDDGVDDELEIKVRLFARIPKKFCDKVSIDDFMYGVDDSVQRAGGYFPHKLPYPPEYMGQQLIYNYDETYDGCKHVIKKTKSGKIHHYLIITYILGVQDITHYISPDTHLKKGRCIYHKFCGDKGKDDRKSWKYYIRCGYHGGDDGLCSEHSRRVKELNMSYSDIKKKFQNYFSSRVSFENRVIIPFHKKWFKKLQKDDSYAFEFLKDSKIETSTYTDKIRDLIFTVKDAKVIK